MRSLSMMSKTSTQKSRINCLLTNSFRVHGVAIDQMIKDEGSFRETLSKGWITSDVLTETLAKFTGDLNESQLKTIVFI